MSFCKFYTAWVETNRVKKCRGAGVFLSALDENEIIVYSSAQVFVVPSASYF